MEGWRERKGCRGRVGGGRMRRGGGEGCEGMESIGPIYM